MIPSFLLRQHEVLQLLYQGLSLPSLQWGYKNNGPPTLKALVSCCCLRCLKDSHQPPKDHQNEWQYYFGPPSFKPGSHHSTQRAPQVQAEADSPIQEQASCRRCERVRPRWKTRFFYCFFSPTRLFKFWDLMLTWLSRLTKISIPSSIVLCSTIFAASCF